MAADRVVEERRIHLAVEIFARELFDREALAIRAVALVVVVPLLEQERNPADLVLDQDDLQARETLQNAGEDQLVEAVNGLEELRVDAVGLEREAAFSQIGRAHV